MKKMIIMAAAALVLSACGEKKQAAKEEDPAMALYRQQNTEYVQQMAQGEGVQELKCGDVSIYYKVLTEGTGEIPQATDRVRVHYEGRDMCGNKFDSSYDREEPTEFACGEVISGWTTALTHMPVGSKWEVYIPAEAAYGDKKVGPLPAYSALTFTIELLEILK